MKNIISTVLSTRGQVATWLLLAFFAWLGDPAKAVAQKKPYRDKFVELDALLESPLKNQIITNDAYADVLYKKQVALTGLTVQQGQTLGTSVTVGDKTVAVNAGLVKLKLVRIPNTALIANGRFNTDQSYAKLFSEEKPQITAGYGGTILFFGHGSSTFAERSKKNLHHKLLEMRKDDVDTTKLKWKTKLEPHTTVSWDAKYVPLMAKFIHKWAKFQLWLRDTPTLEARFYKNELNSTERTDLEGNRRYKEYLAAEYAVLPVLDTEWDGWDQKREIGYLRQQLGREPVDTVVSQATLVDALKKSIEFNATLGRSLASANEATLKARYAVYDSLQQGVRWVRKIRSWVTFSALYNTVEQPIFDGARKKQTYANTFRDEYWQVQLNYSGLLEGSKANLSLTGGVGTSNQVVFKKSDLKTYQTSVKQVNGLDSALVVAQKSLYATVPDRVRYLNLQAQATATLNGSLAGYGITAAYEVLLAKATNAVHNVTIGLVVPIRTSQTTLLLIPQVRARSAEQPDRWSFGFTATATIPGFATSTFK